MLWLLIGQVELGMVRQALVLGLRCTSSSMRNKWADLLAKLLRRILMSVHAVLVKQRAALSRKARGKRVEPDAQSEEDMAGELTNVLRTSGRMVKLLHLSVRFSNAYVLCTLLSKQEQEHSMCGSSLTADSISQCMLHS